MMTIVWSRGAFAILSMASVIALARSSFCRCVLPGYIKTLTIGMEIGQAFPIQESLLGCEIQSNSSTRSKDPFYLTQSVSCASEIRDSPLISLGQSLPH